MIQHQDMPHDPDSPKAFVFAALGGFTCSICAPAAWSAEQVEQFADAKAGQDGWQCVDKAKLMPGTSPTPNPCNHAPEQRQHWFLMYHP